MITLANQKQRTESLRRIIEMSDLNLNERDHNRIAGNLITLTLICSLLVLGATLVSVMVGNYQSKRSVEQVQQFIEKQCERAQEQKEDEH